MSDDDFKNQKLKIESIIRKLENIQKEKKEMEKVLSDIEKDFIEGKSFSDIKRNQKRLRSTLTSIKNTIKK